MRFVDRFRSSGFAQVRDLSKLGTLNATRKPVSFCQLSSMADGVAIPSAN